MTLVRVAVLVGVLAGLSAWSGNAELAAGFAQPPRECSMVPFWSWNGTLEPDEVRRQIDEMVKQGVYGAFMHARAGINLGKTPYFSDGWWEAVGAAVSHGRKVGFKTWIYDEDKWPSGSAGGRVTKRDPIRNARKGLSVVQTDVSGPAPVPIRIPGAQWVIAAKLTGKNQVGPASLRDVSEFNTASASLVDPAATRGLQVTIVRGGLPCLLEARCRALGCKVTVRKLGEEVDLSACDVLISDVGAAGVGVPTAQLRGWIQAGGGYVDFTHSEATAGLYQVKPVVLADEPAHRWLDPTHPIASLPNPDPDAGYAGRRWSDMCWQGGEDFASFVKVLADPRVDGGASVLAREDGQGRAVLCGATQACREPGTLLELLQNLLVYAGRRAVVPRTVAEGKAWTCPAGNWRLFGFVPISKGGVNYLNKQTVRDFLEITHEEYKRRFGEEFGKTIPGVFFDEIHNSGVPIVWSETFAAEFAKRKGYDVWKALVALRADVGSETPKLRCDYYDVYTTIYEDAWFRQTGDWCAGNKLEWTGHTEEGLNAYRNEGDYIRTIRHLQIPGTDNEDFRYSWPRVIDPWKPRQIASVAHTYDRPRAAVEAMGGAGWSFTLDSARYGFNMLAAYGVDFFIPHLFHYAQNNPTNVGDWPNSWFFRNPYWKYFKTLADHSSRLSYLLSGSEPVVDVAILYPQSDVWAGNGGGSTSRLLKSLVSQRVDADLIDPDSLARATIQDGRLCVAKMRYRVLIVPGVRCIRRDALAKIVAFARSGRVLVADRWPEASAEAGQGDAAVRRGVSALQHAKVKLTPAKELTGLLLGSLALDFTAGKGDALRYRHARKEGQDIYWIANSRRQAGTWTARFRATGAPALWNPEDGSIRPVDEFARDGQFTSLKLSLDPWQGVFVVFDPSDERAPKPAPVATSVTVKKLAGEWRFLAVGDALDREWRDDVAQSELSLPTARIRWERETDDMGDWTAVQHDDSRWREVKILDTLHPDAGAQRYRSRWRGRFVSWYDVRTFHARHGGTGWHCRTTVALPRKGAGWLVVIADGAFTLKVGDQEFSGRKRRQPIRFEVKALKAGKTTIEFVAKAKSAAVLIEGKLAGVPVWTDGTWEMSRRGRNWQPAAEFVAPPEKPYGDPKFPTERPLPSVVWYRQQLPPGTIAVRIPAGAAWADGKPLPKGTDWVRVPKAPRVLAIRVADGKGMPTPPQVRCQPSEAKLGDWSQNGLGWYSGRGLYETTFTVTPKQVAAGTLELDLGEVAYCAEIWLNGKLVGTRVWPPYRLPLGKHVRAGENRLVVVVANLLANRMHWDIFDDAKANSSQRKWHDANLLRDAWCFRSGLIGPVRLQQTR
ncbi:MAG: hypothetical protein HN380_16360 [Victivallales bacterium]|nr:hypothetical protein [Victivallales bacterium]